MQQRTQRIQEDDLERRSDISRENSNNSRHAHNENEENKQKEAEKKKKRQTKPRFKFEPKHLKDKNKGLRLFYESASKLKTETNNGENRNDVELLNQFLRLYKEWHFNLVPKFELNYFISKCHNFGRENTIRGYMKSMRSVHTGANTWDAFEEDEDEEPTNPANATQTQTQTQNRQGGPNQTQNNLRPTQTVTQTQNNQGNTRATATNFPNRTQFSNTKIKPQVNKFAENQMRRKAEIEVTRNMNFRESGREPREITNYNSGMRRPTEENHNQNQYRPANPRVVESQEDDFDYNQLLEEAARENEGVAEDPIMDDEFWNHDPNDEFQDPNPNDEYDPDNQDALDEADLEYRIKKLKT